MEITDLCDKVFLGKSVLIAYKGSHYHKNRECILVDDVYGPYYKTTFSKELLNYRDRQYTPCSCAWKPILLVLQGSLTTIETPDGC